MTNNRNGKNNCIRITKNKRGREEHWEESYVDGEWEGQKEDGDGDQTQKNTTTYEEVPHGTLPNTTSAPPGQEGNIPMI